MTKAGTPSRRVAVTGLGIVCALGRNQREFWSRALEGRVGIDRLDRFDADGCLSDIAAQVREIPLPDRLSRDEARRASRSELLCLAAAGEALAQAGLDPSDFPSGIGVSLGCSTAGMLETERYCRTGLKRGFQSARPSLVRRLPNSAPADAVARFAGATGPRLSNMTACASSALAIGIAADLIRNGEAPAMIAGGGDALCPFTYSGFNALRLMDPRPTRPFDASRGGLSLGEGAGILILEDWEIARGRGARILAEFLDYGASCDAHHMTGPHPEGRGAAAAMAEALARAGVPPSAVGHVDAHGTGTPLNDETEVRAILAVFGKEAAGRIPVTAPKSLFGHLLGGAGGAEAVTLVLSLLHQRLPPTAGWSSPDPGVSLDVVAGPFRRHAFDVGLSNSFGFGGSNCALLFRRAA